MTKEETKSDPIKLINKSDKKEKINLLKRVEVKLKNGKTVLTHPKNVEVYKSKGLLAK